MNSEAGRKNEIAEATLCLVDVLLSVDTHSARHWLLNSVGLTFRHDIKNLEKMFRRDVLNEAIKVRDRLTIAIDYANKVGISE